MPTQRIVDLDVVAPERLGVRIDGKVWQLPGDIAIPDYIEIERLAGAIEDPESEARIEDLYEKVLELFRQHNELPRNEDGEEYLPIGPRRLGALVVSLYSGELEEDEEDRPTRPRGTRSTSQSRAKRSRSSK